MGITGSKIAKAEQQEVTTGSVPTTPILTPKFKKNVEDSIDPRSPSCNILRTPITSLASPFTPEPNTCDTFNINSPALVKHIEDPRSPTCAFTRTPIMAAEETDLLKRVQMRNLHNIKKVISDMPSQIPPKLLESSPIHRKPYENKRKSFAGLLETNLDFIETDLDAVILSKSTSNLSKIVSPSKAELKAKFLESLHVTEEQTTEVLVEEAVECDKAHEDIEETQETVESEVEVIIETTKEVVEVAEAIEASIAPLQNLLVDDDGLVIQPRPITPVVDSIPQIIQITPKKAAPPPTVQEFEKKVNHLIYTEDDHVATPPINKRTALHGKNTSKRTPLGTRNGNNGVATQLLAKNKPKLRVSDKPRRADYAVSKIPVFNSKNKAECENTPPRNMLDAGRKVRRAQWDSDNTLII